MRDNSLDAQKFVYDLESHIIRSGLSSKRLTCSAVDNSNFQLNRIFQNRFRIKTRDLNDLILLGILSWYMVEEDRILLQFELEEKMSNNDDLTNLALVLKSKGQMLTFLIETQKWHTRDFFGNIINFERIQRILKLVVPVYSSNRRPKKKVWKRGYDDKGTMRYSHEIHDLSEGSRAQRLLEHKRKSTQDTLLLLEGFLS